MDDYIYECPRCQIGHCSPGKTTYTRLYNGKVISVPDMIVFTCDVCEYQEYDPEALINLQALLGKPRPKVLDENRPKPVTSALDPAATSKLHPPKP